jgi:ATP-binding cassette subfamily B (MDR/TAP) protein 1
MCKCNFYIGPHDELVLNTDGVYSQLILLQGSPGDKQISRQLSAPMSKSTSLSMKRSISGSAGNSSGHSFTLPFGLPGTVELTTGDDTHGEKNKGNDGDNEAPKKSPIVRLALLNKPEVPILLFGSLAAVVHGVLLPIFSLMLSSAIKVFYEPPDKLKKDSSFWGLMCVVIGIISIISIPLEYFLLGIAGGKLIERIRSLSFQSIVHQEVSWFDDPKNSRFVVVFSWFLVCPAFMNLSFMHYNRQIISYSGALGARLSIDALNVRRLVGDNLALIVQIISTLVTGVVIAMRADWKLCLIILCVIPLVGLQSYVQVKFLKGFSQDAKVIL